jgi:hypothetical protein
MWSMVSGLQAAWACEMDYGPSSEWAGVMRSWRVAKHLKRRAKCAKFLELGAILWRELDLELDLRSAQEPFLA